MRTIENTILPPKGYKAITLGPFIFIKKGTVLSYRDIEGTLTKCNITIDQDDTQICYNVLYYNRIHCKVEAKGIASNKLFKTKKELLESL